MASIVEAYSVTDAIIASIAAIIFLFLRFYPIWHNRKQGCDAYYILLCAETLRIQKHLPIRLPPLYLLEEQEQWYPPGFMVLCACLPQNWLKNNYWMLNHLIDLSHILIAYSLSVALGHPSLGALLIIVYGMMPSLVQEYASLNTRPLGMLLQSGFLIAVFFSGQHNYLIAVAVIMGVLLYYSHKLSLQQLWFTMPVIAIVIGEWDWLAWLAILYATSFVVWPRGFIKVLQAHWAIVRFWSQHWPLLGAHIVRQSPVYGDKTTRTDFYASRPGSSLLAFTTEVLHQNYFILPFLALTVLKGTFERIDLFLIGWTLSAYIAAYAINFIKPLRCIGLGRQYVKFGILPVLWFLLINFPLTSSAVIGLFSIAMALELRQYYLVARSMRVQITGQIGRHSKDLVAVLKPILGKHTSLLCLPYHLSDLVAYVARKPVFWGTHSHCFDEKLADFFPVLRRPLHECITQTDLVHLLLDTRYASSKELKLGDENLVSCAGAFELYRLTEAEPGKVA